MGPAWLRRHRPRLGPLDRAFWIIRRGRHGFAGAWRLGKDQALTHPGRPSPPSEPGQKGARRVHDFWAFGTDDVWAAVRTGLLHFDGHTWTEASPESP
jgi:hypothetical protein